MRRAAARTLTTLCYCAASLESSSAFTGALTVSIPAAQRRRSSLYSNIVHNEEALNKLKVVELKKLISDLPASKKKGSSSIRKKADLIAFLAAYYNNISSNTKVEEKDIYDGGKSDAITFEDTSKTQPADTNGSKDVHVVAKKGKRMRNFMPALKDTADYIHELVCERYPQVDPSKYEDNVVPVFGGLGEFDIRAEKHPMLAPLKGKSSDFDVVFVGTASCVPSSTRGVSCTALRLNWRRDKSNVDNLTERKKVGEKTGGTWLFDTGECTQLQMQRVGTLKTGKISKIFLTHCHGDHTFGLPGILCLMGQGAIERDRNSVEKGEGHRQDVIDIYGPQGLRLWLRVAIRFTQSRICPKYRVHELMDVPMAPEWRFHQQSGRYFNKRSLTAEQENWRTAIIEHMQNTKGDDGNWINFSSSKEEDFLPPDSRFGEVPGGTHIYPDYSHPKCVNGAPIYSIIEDEDVHVTAAPMSHGVPCVGYVVEEQPKPGRLNPELVVPTIERNAVALKEQGVRHPMKVMAAIKNLSDGESFTFPDGTIINKDDVVDKDREGRKVVVCGDTADARALENLAMGADILIHECTNAYLRGLDRDTNMRKINLDAKNHGHSTPQIAGDFAKRIGAKKLLLNHFSSRYRGDQSIESLKIMTRIERQAIESSGLAEDCVACAWDFMELPVLSCN